MTLPVRRVAALTVTAATVAMAWAIGATAGAAMPWVGPVAPASAQPAAPPRDPAPPLAQDLPTESQVTRILSDLADPEVKDNEKDDLVQGGIGSEERKAFKRDRLKKATARGQLPVTFAVGNIWPVGTDTAAAEVTITGGKTKEPSHKVFTFVKQGHWMLSSDSAAQLIDTVKS